MAGLLPRDQHQDLSCCTLMEWEWGWALKEPSLCEASQALTSGGPLQMDKCKLSTGRDLVV